MSSNVFLSTDTTMTSEELLPKEQARPAGQIRQGISASSSSARPSGPAKLIDKFNFLRRLNVFARVSDSELQLLADSSCLATYRTGDYIAIESGVVSSRGFIVVSGRLAMTKTSVSGKELIVELLGPGDLLGLLITLSCEEFSTQLSTRAQSDSLILWVPIESFNLVLGQFPLIYRELVGDLLHRLQISYNLSRGLAHDRVEVRIATVLSSLALRFSRQYPSVQEHIIDITRQQVADLSGTTPESAIRVTRAMHKDGLILIKRPGTIQILDLAGLQLLIDGD